MKILAKAIVMVIVLASSVAFAQWPGIATGWHPIQTSGSGGGITNGAANGVIPKSDGTNLVGSGISETAPGRFTLYGAPATSYQSVLTTDWDLGVVVNKQNGVGTAYAFLYDMFRGPAARLVVATGGYVSLGDGSTTSVLRHGMADGAVKWGTPGYPTNTPVPYTHSFATDAPTADTSGANATLTPGIGRGNAAGSTLTISTPDPVASGSTVQTVSPRMRLGADFLTVDPTNASSYLVPSLRFGASATGFSFYTQSNIISWLDGVAYANLRGNDTSLTLLAGIELNLGAPDVTSSGNVGIASASAGVLKVTDGSTGNGTIQIGAGAGAGKVLTSDANGVASWQTAAGGAIGSDTQLNYNDGGTMAAVPGLTYDKTNKLLAFAPTTIPNWQTPFQVNRNGTGQEQAFIASFSGYASATFDSAQNTQVTIQNKTSENNNQSMLMFQSAGGSTAGVGSRNLNHSGWPSMQGELVFATSNGGNPVEKARLTKEGYFVVGANNTNPGTSELYVVGDGYLTEGFAAKSLRMTGASRPTCDSNARGTFWYAPGAGGVKDTVDVCTKDAGDAYAWRTIY